MLLLLQRLPLWKMFNSIWLGAHGVWQELISASMSVVCFIESTFWTISFVIATTTIYQQLRPQLFLLHTKHTLFHTYLLFFVYLVWFFYYLSNPECGCLSQFPFVKFTYSSQQLLVEFCKIHQKSWYRLRVSIGEQFCFVF